MQEPQGQTSLLDYLCKYLLWQGQDVVNNTILFCDSCISLFIAKIIVLYYLVLDCG